MKYFTFILFFFIISCSSAQNNSSVTDKIQIDSLSKYSYELIGFKRIGDTTYRENGTCFFIRKQNRLFLVTAKHVITGCKNGKISITHPDTMYVIIKGVENGIEGSILINILNVNKEGILCLPIEEDPDVKVIEIEAKIPSYVVIYSVENLLKERPANPGDVDMFGFPVSSTKFLPDGNIIYPFPTHLNISITDIHIAENALLKKTGIFDTINYRLAFNNSTVYAEYLGYSGSPVFFTDLNTGERTVQGLFSQVTRDSITKIQISLDLCKIEYATKQIDSILLKNPN